MNYHDKELKEFLIEIAASGIQGYDEIGDDDTLKLTTLYLKSPYGCDSSVIFEDIDLCSCIGKIIGSRNDEELAGARQEMTDFMTIAARSACRVYVDKVLPGMALDAKWANKENAEIDRGDALDNAVTDIAGVFNRFGVK